MTHVARCLSPRVIVSSLQAPKCCQGGSLQHLRRTYDARLDATLLRRPLSQAVRSHVSSPLYSHENAPKRSTEPEKPEERGTTPTSASSAPASGRQSKIWALPFLTTREEALKRCRSMAAVSYALDSPSPLRNILYAAAYWANALFGMSSFIKSFESKVKLKRFSAAFLPYWIVDANISLKCLGQGGKADATFSSLQSRFPGHDWAPFRTLPFQLPHPTKASYEPFDKAKHLSSNDKSDNGEGVQFLPFTVSPLVLPDLIRSAVQTDDTFSIPVPRPGDGPKDFYNAVENITELQDVGEGGVSWHFKNEAEEVRFDSKALDVDFLAAYPVMVPFYFAQCFDAEATAGKTNVTIVVAGWSQDPNLKAFKKGPSGQTLDEEDEDWYTMRGYGTSPLRIGLDIHPRFPLSSSLEWMREAETEKYRKSVKEEEAKLNRELKEKGQEQSYENWKELKNRHSKALETLAASWQNICSGMAETELQATKAQSSSLILSLLIRTEYWMKNLPWERLQRMQREQYQSQEGTSARNRTSKSPEKNHGMGRFIDWENSQIMSIGSAEATENWLYLESLTKFHHIRRSIATFELGAKGIGATTSYGKEAKAAADSLTEARRKVMDRVPSWLRKSKREVTSRKKSIPSRRGQAP